MKGHTTHHGPHSGSAHSAHIAKKHTHNAEHKGHVIHHELHVHKKKGGKVEEGVHDKDESPREVYAGAGSDVVKEAEKRKRGGKMKARKHGGKVEGEHTAHRLDRAPRKRGGRATGGGAELRPMSAAHKMSDRPGGAVEHGDYD